MGREHRPVHALPAPMSALVLLSLIFAGWLGGGPDDYRAGSTQVFGELGYGIKAGNIALEPFANLAYVNVHTNGFTEQGGRRPPSYEHPALLAFQKTAMSQKTITNATPTAQ